MNVAAFFPTSRPKVLVSFPVLKEVRAYIESRCEVMFNETGATLSPDELVRRAHGHNVLMITTTDRLDAHTLGRLPSEIRVIATYSVGHDHIDLPASQARGLTVINTPDVLTDAVAEVAMFLMIGAARRGTESALVSGHVAAAGLDVFAQEPHLHPRYFELPNVFMTPHIGSSTVEARIAMAVALLDALDELAQGLNPLNRLV